MTPYEGYMAKVAGEFDGLTPEAARVARTIEPKWGGCVSDLVVGKAREIMKATAQCAGKETRPVDLNTLNLAWRKHGVRYLREEDQLDVPLPDKLANAVKTAGLLRAKWLGGRLTSGEMPKVTEMMRRYLQRRGLESGLPGPLILKDVRHGASTYPMGLGSYTEGHGAVLGLQIPGHAHGHNFTITSGLQDHNFANYASGGTWHTEEASRRQGIASKATKAIDDLRAALGVRNFRVFATNPGAVKPYRLRQGYQEDFRAGYSKVIADSPAVARDRSRGLAMNRAARAKEEAGEVKEARDPHTGKRIYLSREEAERANQSHAERTGDGIMHPYPCPLGAHWHLGHRQ